MGSHVAQKPSALVCRSAWLVEIKKAYGLIITMQQRRFLQRHSVSVGAVLLHSQLLSNLWVIVARFNQGPLVSEPLRFYSYFENEQFSAGCSISKPCASHFENCLCPGCLPSQPAVSPTARVCFQQSHLPFSPPCYQQMKKAGQEAGGKKLVNRICVNV